MGYKVGGRVQAAGSTVLERTRPKRTFAKARAEPFGRAFRTELAWSLYGWRRLTPNDGGALHFSVGRRLSSTFAGSAEGFRSDGQSRP